MLIRAAWPRSTDHEPDINHISPFRYRHASGSGLYTALLPQGMKIRLHHEYAPSTLMQPSGVSEGGVWVDLYSTDARMVAPCSRRTDRRERLDRLVAIALSGVLSGRSWKPYHKMTSSSILEYSEQY